MTTPSLRSRVEPGRDPSVFTLLLAGVSAFLCLSAASEDWPRRRGPADTGVSRETNWSSSWPVDGPPKRWQAQVGVGFSGPVIAGGKVFTQGQTGEEDAVVALDAGTGRELWRHPQPEPLNPKMYEGGPNSTPTVSGDMVLAASRTGVVRALDAGSGRLLWSVPLAEAAGRTKNDWGLSGAPLVVGDQVILNYGSGATALDRGSGRLLWTMGGGDKNSFCSPVLAESGGEPVLLLHMKKELLGVPLDGGKPRFRHSFGKGFETHCADPVITGRGIFLSSGDDGGELLDVSGKAPRRVWKNRNLGTFTGTAVHLDGYLYGLDAAGYKRGDQSLRCIAVEDGSLKWSLPGFGQGSLIAAGDRLLVLSDQGELAVVRAMPEKSEVLARAQVMGGKCWTQPALADGRIYVRNARGDLVCLDLRG
jgi:outer membrane protein assembly factor BamB